MVVYVCDCVCECQSEILESEQSGALSEQKSHIRIFFNCFNILISVLTKVNYFFYTNRLLFAKIVI